jgi:hypothetical protein
MARVAPRSRLSDTGTGFVPDWARESDDAALRLLLRETPMDGRVRISLEREPSFFRAAEIEGDRHYTAVARSPVSGEIFGMCSRSVREVYVDGELRRLGYLSQLRVSPTRGKSGRTLLRYGFDYLRSTHRTDELPFDVTTVIADNVRARRLLEAGLPNLPSYRRLESLLTFLLPAPRGRGRSAQSVEAGSPRLARSILDCLQRNARRFQFAPHWTERNVCIGGLRWEDFVVAMKGGRVVGCAARWDQRAFKQAVVRGYDPALRRWRPLLNLFGAGLPPVGGVLPFGFVSHLAVDEDDPDIFSDLIGVARSGAGREGCRWLALGLAARHPLAEQVRRQFRGTREYESILYLVHEPGSEVALDGRVPHLEVAVL